VSGHPAIRRAPPQRGRWLFLAILLAFWALLILTAADRFKKPEPADLAYAIPAQALAGVTGLRLEGEGPDSLARVQVVMGYAPDVRITVPAPGGSGLESPDPDTPAEEPLRVLAEREGDTLVLRWMAAPGPGGRMPRGGVKSQPRISEIALPSQFRRLALPHASVEVRAPVAHLEVAAESVSVRGTVDHLDLWSTQCRPCQAGLPPARAGDGVAAQCEEQTQRRQGLLEVTAVDMRSLRVNARAGRLNLGRTQWLKGATLQLGDTVALSMDSARPLALAIQEAGAPEMQVPAICTGAPGAARQAIDLVPAP
jgi:hypothetical protein